jgi:hypothetical protein
LKVLVDGYAWRYPGIEPVKHEFIHAVDGADDATCRADLWARKLGRMNTRVNRLLDGEDVGAWPRRCIAGVPIAWMAPGQRIRRRPTCPASAAP